MVTRSRIASLAGRPQLLMEVTDFTGLGDILAAGSVSLGGFTWTVLNAANGVKLEANGALLDFQSKSEAIGAWFGVNRTALALYCDVTTLDPTATDLDGYEIQLVRNSWPALGNYERLDAGFYEPSSTAIGTNGTLGTGGSASTLSLLKGSTKYNNIAAAGNELDTRVIMAPGGFGITRAQATASAVPSAGTAKHNFTFADVAVKDGTPVLTPLCKPSNARAVIFAVGKSASNGVIWQISAIRVWKFPGA